MFVAAIFCNAIFGVEMMKRKDGALADHKAMRRRATRGRGQKIVPEGRVRVRNQVCWRLEWGCVDFVPGQSMTVSWLTRDTFDTTADGFRISVCTTASADTVNGLQKRSRPLTNSCTERLVVAGRSGAVGPAWREA
jgi:hypothetical protein